MNFLLTDPALAEVGLGRVEPVLRGSQQLILANFPVINKFTDFKHK